MKKLFTTLMLLVVAVIAGFAYNMPDNVYFYQSEKSSTAFTKNGSTFTHTVDATSEDIYGVFINSSATSWDQAHAATAYFQSGSSGDVEIKGATTWDNVAEWITFNNGCLKFVKGNKYNITLTYANGKFTGTFAVEGSTDPDPDPQHGTGLVAGQTYYIDASACGWFFNGNAIIRVNDGASDITCDDTLSPVLSFVPTQNCTKININRCDPNSTGVWNKMENVAASSNGAHNCYAINSNFDGGAWTTYTPQAPTTPQAWIVSKGVNNWDGDAVSDVVFVYDEATKLYTAKVDASKLRASENDGNGFKIGYKAVKNWNNYWGHESESILLENGVAIATRQGSETKNFLMAEDVEGDVTLVFSAENKTLTASWATGEDPDPDPTPDPDPVPEPADDTLVATVPTIDINGETTVEVTLNAADDKTYVSGQWDIDIPAGFSVSNITLNKAVCPNHELLTNTVEGKIKCIAYSASNTSFLPKAGPLFSFTLKAENAAAGTVNGSINGIRFNIAPTAENTNIAYLFDDAEIAITTVKAVKSITASPAALALHVGESQAISLTINPEDATDATVTWSIEAGEDIVALENGTVTALTRGVATIKIVANDGFGAETTIDITVDGKPVENITLDATEMELYAGESFTLVATATPDDATNLGVMWSSSNEDVATVDADGKVTAIAAGEAVITATAKDGSNVNASCAVTVKARISGDADGDDNLTIRDIVIIAKASIGIMTEGMVEENMDLDGDGIFTSTDVTMAVYYLNQLEFSAMPEYADVTTDMLKLSAPQLLTADQFNIPLYLQGATNVAGIQFDVVLPENLTLGENSAVEPAASNGHSLVATRIADNTYRVVIYSANNFKSNAIGHLNVRSEAMLNNARMDVDLNNVMYSNGKTLKATDDTRTTIEVSGIESIFVNGSAVADIYSVNGTILARQADANFVETLPSGIYVVNGQKVIKF